MLLVDFIPEAPIPEAQRRPRHAVVVELTPLLYRVIRARTSDRHQVDDMVQECLTRLLELNDRLSPETLAGYAVVMARNVAASHDRRSERHRRHLHELLELRAPPDPADEAVRNEDLAALQVALDRIGSDERDTLFAHDLEEVPTATLAGRARSSPAAIASQLNRTRGRLRVEYVLALQRVRLPSPRCHQVLMSVSTADRRRQAALDASRHLAECSTCASLSPPLLHRRRGALLLLPVVVLADLLRRGARWCRGNPGPTAAGTAVAAAAVAAVIVATSGGAHPSSPAAAALSQPAATTVTTTTAATTPPSPPANLTVGGLDVMTAPGSLANALAARQGQAVQAGGVTVERLAGAVAPDGQADDERLWVSAGAGRELLVFLHFNTEPAPVVPGEHVRFTGTLRALPANAAGLGLQPGAAAEAAADAYYVEITNPAAFEAEP